MRQRLLLFAFVVLAAAAASGCITSDTVVKVKPNGSGTIELTFLVNTAMFKELGAMMGGGEVKTQGKSTLPSADDMARQLSQMKGVRLVSQTPVKQGTSEGAKILLAFDDVNEISVSENLPGKSLKPKPEDEVKFALTRQPGGNALLSIQFPDKPGEALAEGAQGPPKQNQPRQNQPKQNQPAKKDFDPEMAKMLAGFFKGMRVRIAVDVEGTLVRTSSPYVEGNRVTLLDMDMDQLFSNQAAFAKLESLSLGPDMSITEAREAMAKAGVTGIKINDPKVTIEFK